MLIEKLRIIFLTLLFYEVALCRIHRLKIEDDRRKYFPISTFGFYTGGYLSVNMTNFRLPTASSSIPDDETLLFGFSIDKTVSDAMNPYLETSESKCILGKKLPPKDPQVGILKFIFKFKENRTEVKCSDNIKSISIFNDKETLMQRVKQDSGERFSDSAIFPKLNQRRRRRGSNETSPPETTKPPKTCNNVDIDLVPEFKDGKYSFNTSFVIYIANEKEEGLYSLFFHNCHNYDRNDRVPVSFSIIIEEKNHNDNYLSAGEMPLPALYLLMSVLFFLSGCFWVFLLKKNGTEQVYRIHWIMAALVFLKSMSLFFHGVNYHKIETNGIHIETWAVLYYITHLLKGGLLFFTIVLIGSGWAFIKHIFSDKEKRIFMVVLPLQVIANVAYIIVEESEEGDVIHNYWKDIFILVDLLCCGAILFPVVWSIRHLQEASQTDGKATISLEKLKLFRHFYIMVVCYIYFTRIIVYLLRLTVPFQYEWLDETFHEMATFVFFVMTGYKFRPASNNPYFEIPLDDYDDEEVLIGNTAIDETVTNRKKRVLVEDEDSEDDEGMVFFPKTESSHDLD